MLPRGRKAHGGMGGPEHGDFSRHLPQTMFTNGPDERFWNRIVLSV